MKRLFSRVLSVLLTLALFVGLISGLALHTSAATYVYNWGTRGTLATELSDSASAWYASLGATYEGLSALSGSSSVNSVSTSALYKKLADMMTTKHDDPTSYDATKSLFAYTDCQNGGGKISSFYSGKSIGPDWDNGSTWNREHCWPNSKSNGGSKSNTRRETDIMMLRPTSTSENSSRGNTAYGESSGYYDPNEQSGGTYDLRGDVARVVLYVYVRYGTDSQYHDGALDYMWGSSGVMESKDVLIDWMEADPVDTWELGRNDAVQSITGTRNVFVDYPELAFLLFAEDVPADYDSPSNAGKADFTVTATSNNNAYGTVSVSGRTIIASPATGYAATGYTVTNGTATVTQNGNVFTVNASADCTVQINFAARTPATVTFSENGIQTSQIQGYVGDSLKLPEPTATPSGYTFIGWATAAVDSATDKPSVTDKGATISVPGTVTYYALYSYTTAGGSGGTENIVFDLEDGNNNGNGNETSSEIAANTSFVGSDGTTALTFTSKSKVYRSRDAKGNAGLKLGSSSAYGNFSFTVPDEVQAVIIAVSGRNDKTAGVTLNGESYSITTLSNNGTYTDLTVDTSSNKTVTFASSSGGTDKRAVVNTITYVVSSGGGSSTVYTTAACAHENQSNVTAQAPTCTEIGYTAGVQCDDCGVFIDGHVAVDATGHSYAGVVTPPTAEEDGYTTYTCPDCGDSYVSDYTDALGQTYTVSFSVPAGVTAVGSMSCNNTGILLPTAGAPDGYNFVGWIETQVNNVTEKPTYYAAGSKYVASGNVTLHALYTYTEGGNGNTGYTLTDIANIAASDAVVITVQRTDGNVYAMSNGNGTQAAPSAVGVTVQNDALTGEIAETLLWNIVKNGNEFTIYPNGVTTEWLYCTGTNNGVRVGTNTNKTFVVDAATGYLKHTATARYLGVYNAQDWRCYTTSTTDNIKNQTLGFYVLGSGTTYYTTEIGGSTEPDEPDEPDEPEEENFTLSFRVPAGYSGVATIKGNGAVTLPAAPTLRTGLTGNVSGYTFVGWVEQEYADVTAKPTVYLAGSSYTLSTDTVLYALFTYDNVVSGGATSATLYQGELVEGDYVLVYDGVAMTNKISSNRLANTSVTIKNDTITAPDSAIVWHIAPYDETYWTFYNAAVGKYAAAASDNNKAQLLTAATDSKAQWSVKGTSTYDFQAKSNSRYLRRNGNYGFAAYSSSTGGALSLYKVGSSTTTTTYYTTKEGHDTEADEFAFFAGASVTLGDVLDLNFYVDATEGYLSNDLKVIFTYVGRDGTASDEMVYSAQIYDIDVNGYQFYLSLPAVYMATAVQAVLKDGNTVLQTVNYSIQEYAMSIIGGSYEQKDKNAATAMLNYGAMAQNYFGYKTDALANSTLTNGKFTTTDAELAAAGDLSDYRATITNRASNFIGYTLLLKDVTYIRLYFTEQVTVTLNGAEKTAVKDGDKARYYVEIPGVNAANLGTANTIVCGNMTIENLSVLSLASQVAEDTAKSEAFRNAMIALILYAQSVKTL